MKKLFAIICQSTNATSGTAGGNNCRLHFLNNQASGLGSVGQHRLNFKCKCRVKYALFETG